MEDVFRFDGVYTGMVLKDGLSFPCSLSFQDHEIIFSLVTEGTETFGGQFQDLSLQGYIATEKRVMNFRAIRCVQLSDSYTWSSYGKQKFLANGLLVSDEKNDIGCELFKEASLVFDKFHLIGRFLDIDRTKGDGKDSFTVGQLFDNIKLYEKNNVLVSLENPYRYAFTHSHRQMLNISIEPFISYQPSAPCNLETMSSYAVKTGWFFQLLFGFQQSLTDLILFDSLSEQRHRKPYYYLHKMLIKRKSVPNPIATPHPIFELEALKEKIGAFYASWEAFNRQQQLICRLFFNEANADQVVNDDRFKNYCAIIQGLATLLVARPDKSIKGEMNRKLHNAVDAVLEAKFIAHVSKDFLHQIFYLIAEQRDHYQHLNKKLSVDLCEEPALIFAVNQLLEVIIKNYLFKAIGMDVEMLSQYLDRELYWLTHALFVLKSKLGANK